MRRNTIFIHFLYILIQNKDNNKDSRLRPITNIRIVLLGAKGSGKTSALNTILSRECRRHLGRTARCQVGEGVKFGRQLTVVDTPGWWMNYFSDESSHFDQREMVLSPSLCPPGPHVFLLTIRVDRAFTETHRRSVQEHVELISEHIWSRVILLFTFGDWLGATTTEQYIESEGTPLQWLVDRCSDRYHVLNSRTKGEGFQVRELIGKIEETMSGCCSSWHYEIEMKVLQEVEKRMKREAERLLDLVEEMLVEERLGDLHRGDHMWKGISTEKQQENVTACGKDLTEHLSSGHPPSHDCE
uniref:AIG1-type G domain-containing protein n=1 Tax=Oryzias sinensis TaxID=183150 RepID=A0A8C8DYF7_9TELE